MRPKQLARLRLRSVGGARRLVVTGRDRADRPRDDRRRPADAETIGDRADLVAVGYSNLADYRWTEAGIGNCGGSKPLYCFQQNFDLPQEHFNTECPGPIGWEWHVSRCSNGLYQDPDCAYICCNFYGGTRNCNDIPATFAGYTVNSCSYNTGLYSMSVASGGENFSVTCQLH